MIIEGEALYRKLMVSLSPYYSTDYLKDAVYIIDGEICTVFVTKYDDQTRSDEFYCYHKEGVLKISPSSLTPIEKAKELYPDEFL